MGGVVGMAGKTALQRFHEKHDVDASGCWPWKKGLVFKGYGQFFLNGGSVFAHRASWVLHRGPIPHGLFICHTCDFPRCVNPDHLFLGTNSDNVRDMYSKGRGRPWNSEKTHCKNGHEFTPENTRRLSPGDRRLCITCSNHYSNEYQKRKRRELKEQSNAHC